MRVADGGSPRLEDRRILLVDDEGDGVRALRELLASSGFGNIDFASPREAAGRCATTPPDLILLDLGAAPDDLATLERLAPPTATSDGFPIVVLTDCPDLRARALVAGARDFV